MESDSTAHIAAGSTDGIGVTSGAESDDLSYLRERDEANIRWLLAAVLHHESAAGAPVVDEEE